MSQENVEAVRKVSDAMARDDLDEVLRRCDPDVIYKPAQEAAIYGQQALRRALERWGSDTERLEGFVPRQACGDRRRGRFGSVVPSWA